MQLMLIRTYGNRSNVSVLTAHRVVPMEPMVLPVWWMIQERLKLVIRLPKVRQTHPASSLPDGSANAPATRASQTGPSAPGQLAVQHRQAPSGVGFLGNNMYNISRTYNTTAPFATDPYMTPYRPVGLYAVHPSAGYQSPVLFAPMLYNAGPLDYGPPVEFEQRMAYVRPQGQIQPRWLPPVPVAPYPAAAPSTIREPHFPMQQCTVPAFADPPAPREPYTPVQQRAAPAVAPAVAPVVAPVVAADPPDVGKAGTSKQKRSVSAVADPPYAPKQKRVTFAWTDVDRHGMPMEQRTVSEPVSADPPEVEEQPIEQLADPVVDDPLHVGQHDMPNLQRADAAVTDPMHAGGQFVECGVEAAQEIKQENVITRRQSAMPRRDSQ
ncbi:translation initiation factor IF-2-like [Anopheles stephensi]|uniref:translation initiation factor IF-2-like n=1 Tax=Anopheles stephensi TaxID=30069 RepID=UPI0016589182|nr:translation initiation factor IF-2-like [Anopheles stephensi]